MENTIAVVWDALFMEHRAPDHAGHAGHPERPERLDAARSGLFSAVPTERITPLAPRDATNDELGRVHEPRYVEELSRIAGRRGYLDADTYYAPASYAAALRGAGGSVEMVDALLAGKTAYGIALVRPPGHHARPGTAMGFCLLNNVAVAAAHARASGCERVAIVDWDVHHGNGTQEMFYADPSVLYVSLHQWPLYPGTGARGEVGTGDGVGATVNVPLSPGAGDAAYIAAMDRVVGPAIAEFAPDLLLISAGYDAHELDPLAQMRLTAAGYSQMTRRLTAAMPGGFAGKVGVVLEGGYDLTALRDSLDATVAALEGNAVPAPPSLALEARHDADVRLAEQARTTRRESDRA
ncbi:MAG TPA: histone deacetylase [Polyangiaceae bacterium]|jgi:acetoin utilization deacetylase AcuC-like enzyme|nr:histone deacetylase [Polyangiaceae bacterium]